MTKLRSVVVILGLMTGCVTTGMGAQPGVPYPSDTNCGTRLGWTTLLRVGIDTPPPFLTCEEAQERVTKTFAGRNETGTVIFTTGTIAWDFHDEKFYRKLVETFGDTIEVDARYPDLLGSVR